MASEVAEGAGDGVVDASWGPDQVVDGGGGALRSTGLRVLSPLYRRAGSAYLVGRGRAEAIGLADRLLGAGSDVTLGYWPLKGESVGRVTAEELDTVEALAGHGR